MCVVCDIKDGRIPPDVRQRQEAMLRELSSEVGTEPLSPAKALRVAGMVGANSMVGFARSLVNAVNAPKDVVVLAEALAEAFHDSIETGAKRLERGEPMSEPIPANVVPFTRAVH
jgi:hypothetical protein